jgi:hypothetical protein
MSHLAQVWQYLSMYPNLAMSLSALPVWVSGKYGMRGSAHVLLLIAAASLVVI